VIRTLFLLDYISDVELRRSIHAATNKSEEFNSFVKWLFFGGEGVIAENLRHEQRKVIKYSQLPSSQWRLREDFEGRKHNAVLRRHWLYCQKGQSTLTVSTIGMPGHLQILGNVLELCY